MNTHVFWSKVDKNGPNGCWIWTPGPGHDGYATYSGRRAHRIAYQLVNGMLPVDTKLLHKCDNPLCVNPDHMFEGTLKDNTQDMISKGRMFIPPSDYGSKPKLTWPLVDDIRWLHEQNVTPKELSVYYEVGLSAIYNVLRGITWKRKLESQGIEVNPDMESDIYSFLEGEVRR